LASVADTVVAGTTSTEEPLFSETETLLVAQPFARESRGSGHSAALVAAWHSFGHRLRDANGADELFGAAADDELLADLVSVRTIGNSRRR
jgi:hypothetical protein